MPEGESLRELAVHGSTLAIFLSVTLIEQVVADLVDAYGPAGAVAVVQRASQPGQRILRGTLADIAGQVRAAGISDQAMILVGPTLECTSFPDSRLYAAEFGHRYRRARREGEA
jgi:precorrin-4/cobalt-precorrin-4 C11-methyltransferase